MRWHAAYCTIVHNLNNKLMDPFSSFLYCRLKSTMNLIFCTKYFLGLYLSTFHCLYSKSRHSQGRIENVINLIEVTIFSPIPQLRIESEFIKIAKKSPELPTSTLYLHFKKRISRQNMWAWLLILLSRQYLWLSTWNVSLP